MSNDPRGKAEQVHRNKDAAAHAGERRADYVRALKEERAACEIGGKEDRVKAIDAELKRVGAIKDRVATPKKDEA